MTAKYYYDFCPNCDYKLRIEQWPAVAIILEIDTGSPIDTCPNCLIPLIVIDGELKRDKYDSHNMEGDK